MKLIQRGNTKLSAANIYMFNLPATQEVCGRTCKGCYAIKEANRFPTVQQARQRRYEAALQPDFHRNIIKEISSLRKPPKYFRVHASGEFFSQPYVNSWRTIAKNFPTIVFYAYTKRIKDFDFSELKALPNFVVIDSFQYGGLNYGSLEKASKESFICPHQKGTAIECGIDCSFCMTKEAQSRAPYFKKH